MSDIVTIVGNITVSEIIHVGVVGFGAVCVLIEKSKKLPFNPWSKLFEWIGSKANAPLNERLDLLKKQHKETNEFISKMREEYRESIKSIKEDYNFRIDKLERDEDEKTAKDIRAHIINFSDSCRVHNKHTKTHFENIFRDYDDYLEYCNRHSLENHYIEGEMSYIKCVYEECLKENKFL